MYSYPYPVSDNENEMGCAGSDAPTLHDERVECSYSLYSTNPDPTLI